jgi:hypothetical protein
MAVVGTSRSNIYYMLNITLDLLLNNSRPQSA